MKKLHLFFMFIVCYMSFAQYGVSLGKDGKVYNGETFSQNGFVSPINIPLDKYINLYNNNGIKFSIKLVLGDDPFDRAIMKCEYYEPLKTQIEKDYAGKVIYHYRVVFLFENTNLDKEVEFINTTSSSVNFEIIGEPTVFSICSNSTGTYLSTFTGNIILGPQSSLEICDAHDGEWFFSKPLMTNWFLSNYVLRTANSSTKNTLPITSCYPIPVNYAYNMYDDEPAEPTEPGEKGDSPSKDYDKPEGKKPQFLNDPGANSSNQDFWNGTDTASSGKNEKNSDFWSSTGKEKKAEKKLASTRSDKKKEGYSAKPKEKTIEKKPSNPLIEDGDYSIFGKWLIIGGECFSENGEPLYFIFNKDGTGETNSTNCRKICDDGSFTKYHFTYTNTNIDIKYDHKNPESCQLSIDYPWSVSIKNYTLNKNILSFGGGQFKRQ